MAALCECGGQMMTFGGVLKCTNPQHDRIMAQKNARLRRAGGGAVGGRRTAAGGKSKGNLKKGRSKKKGDKK